MAEQWVHLYTDGACKGNPGKGGWGAWLRYGDQQKALYGGEADTTNNRMELLAVIKGLQAIKRPSHIKLFTDSKYVQQGITQWIHTWQRNGWKTASNKPVKNQQLWQQLHDSAALHHIQWIWVKGHAGDPGNERADQLANQGVDSL